MKDMINASEVGEFVYCEKAYALKAAGAKREVSRAMRAGRAEHEDLNRQVTSVNRGERRALGGVAVAVILLLLAAALFLR